jgi:hypothetical protein
MRWWVLAAVPIACGGRVATEGSDGLSPDAGSTRDDASDVDAGADFPVCPAEPPRVGSACTMRPDQGCRYIDKSTGTCQALACDRAGHWQSVSGAC